MKQVTIYTDGSCLGNPGPGGWAAILRLDGTAHMREISGGFRLTTNNRMELMGALCALEALTMPCRVAMHTDSQYLANAITKGWLENWNRLQFVRRNKQPVPNADLWRRLMPLLGKHTIKFIWVRGHAGNPDNERCDQLARACAAQPGLPPDMTYEAMTRHGRDPD